MKFSLLTAVLMLSSVVGAGCSIKAVLEDDSLGLELAVRATTARVLSDHPQWIPAAVSITADAMALTHRDPLISLSKLKAEIIGRIPWDKLTPEEHTLLSLLISQVSKDLFIHLEEQGVSDPQATSVRATEILEWIHQTANRATRLDISQLKEDSIDDTWHTTRLVEG